MAPLIQCTRTWANSGRWWGTEKPGARRSVGWQRVEQDLETEQVKRHKRALLWYGGGLAFWHHVEIYYCVSLVFLVCQPFPSSRLFSCGWILVYEFPLKRVVQLSKSLKTTFQLSPCRCWIQQDCYGLWSEFLLTQQYSLPFVLSSMTLHSLILLQRNIQMIFLRELIVICTMT